MTYSPFSPASPLRFCQNGFLFIWRTGLYSQRVNWVGIPDEFGGTEETGICSEQIVLFLCDFASRG